jgi:myo-inositol-1(or 4)-monophosphatase
MSEADISEHDIADMERLAVDLATLGGARAMAGLGRELSVRYKREDETEFRDPVSEIDEEVERLIRERVGERFPDHDILGEESEERPGHGHDFIWAVDPVDGTTNFVNGFPLFACSIGVIRQGRPIAGAVWCSATHALRPGVYHARLGGELSFDSEALGRTPNPAVRRRLSGLGSLDFGKSQDWEIRKTGSAALECAFVATGLLNVAGGLALVFAAGGTAYVRRCDNITYGK